METAAGDSGDWLHPEHFDSADGARTENGMHPRREYKIVASEVTVRGQASKGAADREVGHGAMKTRAGQRKAEEGEENPQRTLPAQQHDGGETEARAPLNSRTRLTRAAA